MTYCILLREPDGRQEILYPTVSGQLPAAGSTIHVDDRRLMVTAIEHHARKDDCGVVMSNAVVLTYDLDTELPF